MESADWHLDFLCRYILNSSMPGEIDIWILGDFGPFSMTGKSIGYEVGIGGRKFLFDCGAPLFNMLGGRRLGHVDGLIVTHCHDDHKRWFSDLALYHRYAAAAPEKISLITSEDVLSELTVSSAPAIDRSLSEDSARVIDIAFDEYTETKLIGPKAKYRIVSRPQETRLMVVDAGGNAVGPERAKIVVSPKTGRPRMLFRDTECGEWVEPESYYPFSSHAFYEDDKRLYTGDGFRIEAVKAPVWHGIPGIGIKFSTGRETLFITSDTVHDIRLWERLAGEKQTQRLNSTKKEFDSASVIHGDINDYIERTWSKSRFEEARRCFDGCVVMHDISTGGSTVHTDYERLDKTFLRRGRTILTHSPDRMTSEWALCYSGKTYRIKGDDVLELVNGEVLPLDADIYHKENGRFYVGYRSNNGHHTVYECGGTLHLPLKDTSDTSGGAAPGGDGGKPMFNVDLYEDIGGQYFPVEEGPDRKYVTRADGKVELVEFFEDGSAGKVIEGSRTPAIKGSRTPATGRGPERNRIPRPSDIKTKT